MGAERQAAVKARKKQRDEAKKKKQTRIKTTRAMPLEKQAPASTLRKKKRAAGHAAGPPGVWECTPGRTAHSSRSAKGETCCVFLFIMMMDDEHKENRVKQRMKDAARRCSTKLCAPLVAEIAFKGRGLGSHFRRNVQMEGKQPA